MADITHHVILTLVNSTYYLDSTFVHKTVGYESARHYIIKEPVNGIYEVTVFVERNSQIPAGTIIHNVIDLSPLGWEPGGKYEVLTIVKERNTELIRTITRHVIPNESKMTTFFNSEIHTTGSARDVVSNIFSFLSKESKTEVSINLPQEQIPLESIESILQHLDNLMKELGFEMEAEGEKVYGSFFQNITYKVKKSFSKKKAQENLDQLTNILQSLTADESHSQLHISCLTATSLMGFR